MTIITTYPLIIDLLIVGLDRLRFGWCQGAHARDCNGRIARFDGIGVHGEPVSFSSYGALGGHNVIDMMRARDALWKCLGARGVGFGSLNEWNDAPGRTQDEVIALYQDTIDKGSAA